MRRQGKESCEEKRRNEQRKESLCHVGVPTGVLTENPTFMHCIMHLWPKPKLHCMLAGKHAV